MKTNSIIKRMYFLTIFISWSVAIFFTSLGFAETSNLSVNVKDSTIELKTEKVPLGDVLKAVCDRTGISITMDGSMTELVSINLKVPVEECFHRLLQHKNHVMIYEDRGSGEKVLSEVYVISSGPTVKYGGKSDSPQDSFKSYTKETFNKELGKGRPLSHLIVATPVNEGFGNSGIKIKDLPGNSPFHKIGLDAGDLIVDVNGKRVGTVEEFINELQSASQGQSSIRIDRRKSDNRIDPIYINFR